ncbi:MAG: hypothetical protein AB8B85_08585 [Paracoccaceae bacterium]
MTPTNTRTEIWADTRAHIRAKTRAVILAVCVLFATSAHATNWQVVDLGRLHLERHCVEAANETFHALLGEARISQISVTSWVAYADGINGGHDAVITCTHGNSGGTRATLVLHSSDQPTDGRFLAQRIILMFDDKSQKITQAWKDRYK